MMVGDAATLTFYSFLNFLFFRGGGEGDEEWRASSPVSIETSYQRI